MSEFFQDCGKVQWVRWIGMFTVCLPCLLVSGLVLPTAGGAEPDGNLSQPPPAEWLKTVQESICRMEYEVSWQETGLPPALPASFHMANREKDIRAFFSQEGVTLLRRTGTPTSTSFKCSPQSIGQGNIIHTLNSARLSTRSNSLSYQFDSLSVQYLNAESGLHQTMMLENPIEGKGPLQIKIALESGTQGRWCVHENVVDMSGENGVIIRWHRFHASDSHGADLPMEVMRDPGSVILSINDTHAVYPLSVESVLEGGIDKGLSVTPGWIGLGAQESALYGMSACTAGDVNGDGYSDVLVAAPFYDNGQADEGRVFCYGGNEDGLSTTAGWTAESNQVGAVFGFSMSTAGDVNGDGLSDFIVGAANARVAGASAGVVYGWHGQKDVPPPGTPENADWVVAEGVSNQFRFGFSVSTAGDVNGDGYSDVIVGESLYAFGGSPRRMVVDMSKSTSMEEEADGIEEIEKNQKDDLETAERVCVYYGSANGLSTTADWTADSSSQLPTLFGYSVGTAGDVNNDGYSDIIVGSPFYFGSGRAFVWYGSALGLGEEGAPGNADWEAICSQTEAWFGVSVSTAGDVNGDGYSDVVAGSNAYDNSEENEGAVFVWHGSASGPNAGVDGTPANAAWMAESNRVNAQLGVSVGTAGDVNGDGYGDLIAGCWRLSNGQGNEGAAFVWQGSATGLKDPTSPAWWAESNMLSAYMGFSVGTAGDVNGDGYSDVIVGAFMYTHDYLAEGGASVYMGSPAGLASTAGWAAVGEGVGRNLGGSVATAGDINADGFADVIVGAPNYEGGGRVFLFAGTAQGLTVEPVDWIARTDPLTEGFGRAIGSAGDVNGDGYSDVIVGAYETGTDDGEAQVFYGAVDGLPVSPNWTAVPNQAGAEFGYSVGTAGDVNGDGYSDIIIGSPRYTHGQTDEGAAFVWYGSETGLGEEGTPDNADWSKEGNQENAHLGFSVGTAGDVNADGYSDVIFGAPDYSHGEPEEGRVYVYHGSPEGLHDDVFLLDWAGEIDQGEAGFGYSVGTAGDVNGDGYSDIIIGANMYNDDFENEGQVFVYYGSKRWLSTTPSWQFGSGQRDAYLGYSVGTAGDVNGDGYADVIVGADQYGDGESSEGRVYVFHGSSTGLSPAPDWFADGNLNSALLGYSVGTAGDVNGDGYADVIVGAINYQYTLPGEGAAFLSYGNKGRGVSLRARQRTVGNFGPVSHLGLSDTYSSIHLAARKSSPFGGKRIALECEVKPLGIPFSGTGTVLTGYDVTSASATITHLFPDSPYHWRLRFRYHPAAFPYQSASRWFTVPWNGWQETDFRTRGAGAGLYGRVEHLFMCSREYRNGPSEDIRAEDLITCLELFPSLEGVMLSREDFLRQLWE